jgi:ankyrin repeat protein
LFPNKTKKTKNKNMTTTWEHVREIQWIGLWESIRDGDLKRVQEILLSVKNDSFNINGPISADGWNALHEACLCGQIDIVKYLCSLPSVDINKKHTLTGWVPLHCATAKHAYDIVEYLFLLKKINIQIVTPVLINEDSTSRIWRRATLELPSFFHWICYCGHTSVIDILYSCSNSNDSLKQQLEKLEE